MSRIAGEVTIAVGCALVLAACGVGRSELKLDAEPSLMPRLAALLASNPLPEGWTAVSDPGPRGYALKLRLGNADARPESTAALCGTEYLAAAVELADARYSVNKAVAEGIGLEPLERILPPRRALAIDGLWPSTEGYPFVRALYLSATGPGGRHPPRKLLAWLKAAATAAMTAESPPLLLAAAGDIQIGEQQGPALLGGEAGIRDLLQGDIASHLRGADLFVANLESPISSRGEPNPRKRYHFRMPPGSAAALKSAGLSLVLFGNNHVLDFGPEAFSDTLDDLDAAGLPMVGAGRDLAEASAARFVVPRRGGRLAFVGYAFFPNEISGFTRTEAAAGKDSPGIAANEQAALAAIREAAATGATVVVLAHGGTEYQLRPSDAARSLYARFADAGAALVIGSHPHLLQGCGARAGALIAYSLGNFIFTYEDEPPAAWKGAVLDFLLYQGRVRGVLPRPIIAGYFRTEPDPDIAGTEARFSGLSAGIAKLPPLPASPK